jgi:hypothetical protein
LPGVLTPANLEIDDCKLRKGGGLLSGQVGEVLNHLVGRFVGKGWRAADPSPEMSLLKFMAKRERDTSNVIHFRHAKRLLGLGVAELVAPLN